MAKIHSTSIVSKEAEIAEDVEIGPFTVIEGKVKIGKGTKVGSRVTIKGNTTIGEGCRIYDGAIIGEEPQHLRYKGEETEVIIGNRVIVREYVTIHRGTAIGIEKTVVEDEVMLMAYSHVAHDCIVRKGVIMANCSALAGHVEVGEYTFIGGLSAVQQWRKIGRFCMIGGLTGVTKDIPPFTIASGQHAKLYGINIKGLKNRGFDEKVISALKHAYIELFKKENPLKESIQKVREEFGNIKEVEEFLEFIEKSEQGVPKDAKS